MASVFVSARILYPNKQSSHSYLQKRRQTVPFLLFRDEDLIDFVVAANVSERSRTGNLTGVNPSDPHHPEDSRRGSVASVNSVASVESDSDFFQRSHMPPIQIPCDLESMVISAEPRPIEITDTRIHRGPDREHASADDTLVQTPANNRVENSGTQDHSKHIKRRAEVNVSVQNSLSRLRALDPFGELDIRDSDLRPSSDASNRLISSESSVESDAAAYRYSRHVTVGSAGSTASLPSSAEQSREPSASNRRHSSVILQVVKIVWASMLDTHVN